MDKIPKKFARVSHSFMDVIRNDAGKSGSMSSFCAFPQNASFAGMDRDENVILLIRKHPASFYVQYLMIFVFVLLPFVFMFGLNGLGVDGTSIGSLVAASFIIFWLLAFTIGVDTFLKWFYSVNIITDQRIVDVDFHNVLYHKVTEAQIEKIEDITHNVDGILGSIFDFGSVYIQTAGAKNEIEFESVPRPRDIQDVLADLTELKQKGQI